MLVEKQQGEDQRQGKFWIDPEMEVALTAQINEHFPALGSAPHTAGAHPAGAPELMDCYNRPEESPQATSEDD
jgi:hypothetical protein